MRKKTRAPGGGRKPLDPSGSDIVMIRIPPKLRREIERLAKKHGLSRPGLIRTALGHWVGRFEGRTLHTETLADAVVLLADQIERRSGKKWIEDAVTGVALRKQVERLIYHFAPTPAKPVPPEAEVVPPELDVVGWIITMIENTVPVKGVPPMIFSNDQRLSETLRALARQPPYGLGSGWQRNRAARQGKAKQGKAKP
jgi:Ribbon-helix-helix protein, copG family